MPQLSAQQKHDILIHCESRPQGVSEVAIAALHGATVSRATIWNWRQRWNHTPQSLEHAAVAGRPSTLTPLEISRHVRTPILAANRTHHAVSYTKLLPQVKRKTGKELSLRTLQRTGKEKLGVEAKHTKKRTADESKCIHIHESE
jgi:transposase